MPRALIVGCNGQDGQILWRQLADRGYSLLGISRHGTRAQGCDWSDAVDVTDGDAVRGLIAEFRPAETYYLAAYHHSSQDPAVDQATLWARSFAINTQGFQNVLDAHCQANRDGRIFYASSSRVFGAARAGTQDESTALRPACLYGITKATGMMLADYYRRDHGLFASCGILYNHESPLRGRSFLSQRVAHGLVAVKRGTATELVLGDLDSKVDWGYAPDYTEAMQRILQCDTAGDFVIASGSLRSVRDMVSVAAGLLDLDWRSCVVEDRSLVTRPSQQLTGDAGKLRRLTAWAPRTTFEEMVRELVLAAAACQGLAVD